MIFSRRCFLGAASALGLSSTTLPLWGQSPATIRVSHGLTDESHLGRALAEFAREVEAQSAGKLKVQVQSKSVAGSDEQVLKKLLDGSYEMLVGGNSAFVPAAKELAVWDTPFLFANYAEAHAILDGPIGNKVTDAMKAGGLIGLSFWENGFRNVTNNKRPIFKREDFNGLKLRVMSSEIAVNTFKNLGVDAIPMAFKDVYDGIKNGTVDGQENPSPNIIAAKLYEVQKYLTITRHVYSVNTFAASKKWWDTLPEAHRKIVKDAAYKTRVFQREAARKGEEDGLAQLKGFGMQVNELAVGERTRIENRLEKVNARIAAQVGLSLWIELNDALVKLRQARV